jgi:asparagine synthase (glutamine-hydrolysing)
LDERVVHCDARELARLPQATCAPAIVGCWPPQSTGTTQPTDTTWLQGDLDACTRNGAPLDSLAALAALATTNELHDVDGAYHFASAVAGDRHRPAQLTLARDAIGHHSMYYARTTDGRLAFATDVQSLVARSDVGRALDPRAIAAYLACAYVPGTATLFQGVRELLPGQLARATQTGSGDLDLQEIAYFSLPEEDSRAVSSAESDRHHIALLRTALETAVRTTHDPAAPAAAFLSGGIDSSVVVALVQGLRTAAGASPLHTYSIAFGAEYKNELEHSSLVARHVGSAHSVVHLTPESIISNLDVTHRLLASPIGDPLTVPNAILFRYARESAGVVWNGEGGDPCFGGPKNLPMVLAELYGDGENTASDASPRARSYYRAHLKCFDDLDSLLTASAQAVLRTDPLEREVESYFHESRSFVGALSAINVVWKGGHHILPKVQKLAAGLGIRPRSPLFSKSIVEFAARLPANLKLRGSVEKYALKEAVRDLLPKSIIDRPKSGMMVPVEAWFQGPLLALARERLLGGALPFDILQRSAIEALVDGKSSALRPRRGVKIWLLVALESYLRQFN